MWGFPSMGVQYEYSGGFLKWGYCTPIAGWFIMENPNKKWMIKGGII